MLTSWNKRLPVSESLNGLRSKVRASRRCICHSHIVPSRSRRSASLKGRPLSRGCSPSGEGCLCLLNGRGGARERAAALGLRAPATRRGQGGAPAAKRGRTTLTSVRSGADSSTQLGYVMVCRCWWTQRTVTIPSSGWAGRRAGCQASLRARRRGAWCGAVTARRAQSLRRPRPRRRGLADRRARVVAVSGPAHPASASCARHRISPSRRP